MVYEEQQIISFSVLTIMMFLVFTYILSVTVGLFILSNDVYELRNVKTVVTHEPRSISLNAKKIPAMPKPKPIVESKIVKSEDLNLLAHIINAEAGNQPYEGKLAVGNVIMNRVESPKFPDTIRDVVYQKGQFSPVTDGSIKKEPNKDSIKAAKEVLNGKKVVHNNVLFFYNPDISTSKWIFTREVVKKIGSHAFAL